MPRNSDNKFTQKEFLKIRRPERFSDSVTKDIGRLGRAVLEHHLSTLNRRSKELDFESFAKKLCEKIICPNLLEQTGPVAGGDGKVDTQTFPVSEQSKLLWYVGANDNSDKDRWAFAVSTQENWKAKCRKDVKKIFATDRGYKKVFCVTNQYAKANQRSEIEDALKEETGIDVRILDASWILDEVFKNGLEKLAIDELSIDVDWRREVKIGANDYAKNERIDEIEKIISNEVDPDNIEKYHINLFVEQAVLAKELERPRIESEGLFNRAVKIAEKFGNLYSRFDAHYQFAWAAYWWYEDIAVFEAHLKECLELAKEINMSGQWRDAAILLGLYTTYSRSSEINLDITSLKNDAIQGLEELGSQGHRPSNSLMAKVYIEVLSLHSIDKSEDGSVIFSKLLEIVKEGENLVGFSFDEIYNLVSELDFSFGEDESYEALMDYFTEQSSIRNGELEEARLWLKRGARRLESNQPYQSIKLIGKSLAALYKKEAKKDLYVALNLLSEAYRKVGLLWASRANLLLAASIVTDEFWNAGELLPAQVHSYVRLAKAELLIGRLNYALKWWELACAVNSSIEENVVSERDYQGFDAFLSQCFLNCKLEDLSEFDALPDYLDRYQLFVSRSMLLHALGHEDLVQEEYELEINEEYIEYLKIVRDVDLGAIAPNISLCDGRYTELTSYVMGCEIKVSFPFRCPIVELAETILSAIESMFSTAMVDSVMVLEPKLKIEITVDDDDEISISHELDDSGSILKIDVLCSSFTPEKLSISGQSIIQDWLFRFVIDVFAHMLRPTEHEKTLDSMIGKDRAIERSVSFGSCFVGQKNIMGDNYLNSIKGVFAGQNIKAYALLRSSPWDKDFPKEKTVTGELGDYKPGEGEPSKELTDEEGRTHRDLRIHGLIKTRLWNRTVWKGTSYAVYPDGTPEMILLFKDEDAASAIFDDLQNELGLKDTRNRLRVSIIRNINKAYPAHYRVCIGENIDLNENQIAQMTCRLNTMEPQNKQSVESFLAAISEVGCYMLGYGCIKDGEIIIPKGNRVTIFKSQINVMEEWEIGPNHLEAMAVQESDDPIIPCGVEDPPIHKVFKRRFRY